MDQIHGKHGQQLGRPRVKLARGADGHLRPASSDSDDIADIWAEQRRIQLAEAIEEDKRKDARRQLRKERGLFGLAKTELSQFTAKTRTALFGEQPRNKQSSTSHPKNETATKVVEVKIALPLPPKPNMRSLAARIKKRVPHISKTAVIFIVIALAIVIAGYRLAATNAPGKNAKSASIEKNAERQSTTPASDTPTYLTILPAGKSIQGLGGWARVSPPDHNPVYAFADRIGNTHIDVSEQPLPPNFQADTAGQIAQLAQSYSANQKLTAGGVTVYVGTSAQGPQSVIFTEDGLLILIKSATPVPSNQWIVYVNSLQ